MVRILLFSRWCTQYWLCLVLGVSLASSSFAQLPDNREIQCDTSGVKVMCMVVDSTDYVWEIHRFKKDMKWGAWKYFNGNHEMIEQILYRRNKRIWTYFYRDGEVIKSINKKGKVKKFKGCGC